MSKKLPSHSSSDFEGPGNFEIDLSSTLDEIERPDMAVVTDADLNSPHVLEYAKDLAFMEDMLTIQVAKSEDRNAPDPVSCGVNGVPKLFKRGEVYKVAHKFVDALIKTSFRTETIQFKDANGIDQTKIEQIPVHNVTVQVFEDPAGDVGRRWMQHKLSTPF